MLAVHGAAWGGSGSAGQPLMAAVGWDRESERESKGKSWLAILANSQAAKGRRETEVKGGR